VIDRSIVKNLSIYTDEETREVAEQFICIVCNRFVVPKFTIGKQGIKPDSVLLP